MTASCRSCGAPILWARTASGRRMPVDEAPSPEGNLVISIGKGGVLGVEVVSRRGGDARPRHRPHFATCPEAESWRRR